MKAHLVQLDIQWEDPQTNYARVRSLLDTIRISPGDLIALPELFDAGFSLNTKTTCDMNNSTLEFLSDLAQETGCMIQGSRSIFPAQDSESLALNCATVCAPGGKNPVCEYHKVHPFSMGSEPKSFQGGNEVVQYDWVAGNETLKVCPFICYDLRFPELFRKGFVDGAEMFVLGANWPNARQHHWRSLLIARAIENQAFMLGINRCGDDPYLSYSGGTIAIDPMGTVLGELGDEEAVLSVEIDPTMLRDWRSKFRVIDDIKIRSF
ncbi:MAG: hypothetical protein JJ974_06920 [Phycisphaerales bacterium]|nr:hypothetical protein [Phycisphaerales bacterium]